MNVEELKKYLYSLERSYQDVPGFVEKINNIISKEISVEEIALILKNMITNELDSDLKTTLLTVINQISPYTEPVITNLDEIQETLILPKLERIPEQPIEETDITLGLIDKYKEELTTLNSDEIGSLLISPKVDDANVISVTLSKKLTNSTTKEAINDIFSFDYNRNEFFNNKIYDRILDSFATQDKILVNGVEQNSDENNYVYFAALNNGNELKVTNLRQVIHDKTKDYVAIKNNGVNVNTIEKEPKQLKKITTDAGFTNFLLLLMLMLMIIGCILFTVYLFK